MKDKNLMTHPSLVEQEALLAVAKRTKAETPFVLIDLSRIKANCRKLQRLFPTIDIYYAIKANSSAPILSAVHDTGIGFEVASSKELQQALSITQSIDSIISSHPVKSPRYIEELVQYGSDYFVFDTKCELDKIATYAPPGSRAVLRLAIKSAKAGYPPSGKFGAVPEDALELLLYAQNCGLSPCGLTFHLGSQCRDIASWERAIMALQEFVPKFVIRDTDTSLIWPTRDVSVSRMTN